MDSINKQQVEENHKDLHGIEAGAKIKEMAETANTCFFCSNIKAGAPMDTRPMSVQKVDDDGTFWFLSATDSHKNAELHKDPYVQLLFQASAYTDFLSIYGKATISKDKQKIKELWQPILKTWFTGGEDDPRISVIKVETKEGYYWDTKHGRIVSFIKTVAGAITGQTLDDSIEGKLAV